MARVRTRARKSKEAALHLEEGRRAVRRLRPEWRHAGSHRRAEHNVLLARRRAGNECRRLVLHTHKLDLPGLRVVAETADGRRDGHRVHAVEGSSERGRHGDVSVEDALRRVAGRAVQRRLRLLTLRRRSGARAVHEGTDLTDTRVRLQVRVQKLAGAARCARRHTPVNF